MYGQSCSGVVSMNVTKIVLTNGHMIIWLVGIVKYKGLGVHFFMVGLMLVGAMIVTFAFSFNKHRLFNLNSFD